MRRVHIHEAASREAIEAAAWYELKRPGLGVEFQRAIETALDLLSEDVVPLTPVHSAGKVRECSGLARVLRALTVISACGLEAHLGCAICARGSIVVLGMVTLSRRKASV
jgi:hypothetical protein